MSAVTFSGFNNIDWGTILNAMMAQERQPLTTLQTQQATLKTQVTALTTLATKLGALGTAAEALSQADAFGGRNVSSTDDTVVTASGGTDAAPGIYDVLVVERARAQVTASSSNHAATDIVATAGTAEDPSTLVIGGVTVTVTEDLTLQGLASAINNTSGIGVTASVVSPTSGRYQLVLTGKESGAASAFTITNGLNGSSLAFTDTDTDGISGDSALDNAMSATDAEVEVNNVRILSATNTIDDAIPGVTLNLLKKQPGSAVTVSVTETTEATSTLVNGFVSAYNNLVTFAQQQSSSSSGIGRDPMFRSLRNELRLVLAGQYVDGNSLESLGAAGIEFDRTGKMSVNTTVFNEALKSNGTDLRTLFMGDGVNPGVFDTLATTVERYTDAGAVLSDVKDRINEQIRTMDTRMADMEARLETRRAALQREYTAADSVITQLNSQMGSLSSLGSQYSLF